MFPSRRRHPYLPYRREDSNIFYPALIDFTLSPLLNRLIGEERRLVEKMLAGVRRNYPAYESLRQSGLYNFYRTNPPDAYPNGYLLRHLKHFRLAEDADDTVMISTVLDDLPAEQIGLLRAELVRFSNRPERKYHHPLPGYAQIPAHAVWLGTGAMPVEIDVCVLCNILYFTAKKGCAFNDTDRASLAFIRQAVTTGDVFRYPFQLSYYYPDPTVILYHVARLWSVLPGAEEELPREEIVTGLRRRSGEESNLVARLMLGSALRKMGEEVEPIHYTAPEFATAGKAFTFFIAPMLAGTRSRIMNKLAERRLFQVDYVCEAYYYALALEYELLR